MRSIAHRTRRPLSPSLRHVAASAFAAALLTTLLPAGQAGAEVRFEIPGRGFGHGVGMSQWGAYGFAQQGRGHEAILRHYYSGTRLTKTGSREVRVLLSVRPSSVAFANARKACGRKLDPGKVYKAALDGAGGNVRLESAKGKKLAGCGSRLTAAGKGKIKIDGDGTYRGKLSALASSGDLNVVNKLPLDGYVRGVVPNEVPASWPAAALRAQAVAARSYALTTRVDGSGFDLYDDTRSQVYVGVATEQATTNKAVKQTAGEVLTDNGKVVTTFYFSSSGGRTENSEFGFAGGSSRSYLKSVPDPFDDASPFHKWTVRMSRSEMQGKLAGLVKGKLRDIEITKTGRSPRIVRAEVIGSDGKTTVSGEDLRFRLGLRSTWAKFKKQG